MPNSNTSLSASFNEVWDKMSEKVFARNLVYRAISDTTLDNQMKSGDVFHRQYLTALPRPRQTTRYSDGTLREMPYSDETLTVDQEPEVWTDLADGDRTQSVFDLGADFKSKLLPRMMEHIDGNILAYGAANAGLDLDDLDVNPSTGTDNLGVTTNSSNVYDIFALARKKLNKAAKANGIGGPFWAVVSPDVKMQMQLSVYGRNTEWGDSVGKNGLVTDNYAGFKIYESTSNYFSAYAAIATDPADGDTLVIKFNSDMEIDNGLKTITIRFKTTATQALDVQRGGGVATTRINLAAMLNSTGVVNTDNTTYWTPTDVQRDALVGIAATDDASAGVTITFPGFGALTLSDTLTAAADGFTAAKQIESALCGVGKPISVVTQSGVKLTEKPYGSTQRKTLFSGSALFGRKTWRDTKFNLLNLKVRADAYGAS